MREYEKHRPFLIVGETADDYLGEYMAGGVVMVLNLSDSERPARNYIGTGMVGGRIYIRGKVSEEQVGLIPQREDVLRYLHAQTLDGTLSEGGLRSDSPGRVPERPAALEDPPGGPHDEGPAALLLDQVHEANHGRERGGSATRTSAIVGPKLEEFFKAFALPDETRQRVLASEFTVIRVREEKKEMHVPPQETPVEE